MMDSSIRYRFPDPSSANEDGLVAVGGNLTSECLLSAYQHGIFPWFNPGDPILWWSPDPRMVIYPEQLRLNRSIQRTIRNHRFEFSFDYCFEQVIIQCAAPRKDSVPDSAATWIGDDMITAYVDLHHAGHAHSVECWLDGELCGGVYGVALGSVFFGESMFSRASEASKLALITLIKQLQLWDYDLLDCQLPSELVRRLGATNIARNEFTRVVREKTAHIQTENWSEYQPVSLRE